MPWQPSRWLWSLVRVRKWLNNRNNNIIITFPQFALPSAKRKRKKDPYRYSTVRKLKWHVRQADCTRSHIIQSYRGQMSLFPFQQLVTPPPAFQSVARCLRPFYYSSPTLLHSSPGLRRGAIVKVTRYNLTPRQGASIFANHVS